LTCLSEDPKDLSPLTSAMFIHNIQIVSVQDLDHLSEVSNTNQFKYQQ
jgi:hypothetical protein